MNATVMIGGGRWVVATAGAAVIMIMLLWLFRVPAPAPALTTQSVVRTPATSVEIARPDRTDRLLEAEAELRDLRPLFLPTARNAALPEPRLEPGRTFLEAETLQPKVTSPEAKLANDLPALATLNGQAVEEATPADVLSPTETPLSLQSFGRAPLDVTEFRARGGYVEVSALRDGRKVLGEPLPVDARPATDKAWSPVEFIAVVDAAGLVGPLVVTDGSRVDEIDAYYRSYLAQNFRLGQRLAAGFYRVTVAP